MKFVKFTCLKEKCPKNCCSNLKLKTKDVSNVKFSYGTIKDDETTWGSTPNRILQVSESQLRPDKKYLPAVIGKLEDGNFAWYGRQLTWENGSCSQYDSNLCSDYNNRPYQCRMYPLSSENNTLVTDPGCPIAVIAKRKGFDGVALGDKMKKYTPLVYLLSVALAVNVHADNVKELLHVHPETKSLNSISPPKYHLLIDIEDNFPVTKVTLTKGKNKKEVSINLKKFNINPSQKQKSILRGRLIIR